MRTWNAPSAMNGTTVGPAPATPGVGAGGAFGGIMGGADVQAMNRQNMRGGRQYLRGLQQFQGRGYNNQGAINNARSGLNYLQRGYRQNQNELGDDAGDETGSPIASAMQAPPGSYVPGMGSTPDYLRSRYGSSQGQSTQGYLAQKYGSSPLVRSFMG